MVCLLQVEDVCDNTAVDSTFISFVGKTRHWSLFLFPLVSFEQLSILAASKGIRAWSLFIASGRVGVVLHEQLPLEAFSGISLFSGTGRSW